MNARPMVWRTRTNGNAQIVIASRSQTLSGQFSIQRKNGSMRAKCYWTHVERNRDERRKDECVTNPALRFLRVFVVRRRTWKLGLESREFEGRWNRRSHADS